MNKKCASKLASRWALLAFVVSALTLLGYWKFVGIPTDETIRYSGREADVFSVPISVSRFVAPVVVAVVTYAIFYFLFHKQQLLSWYSNQTEIPDKNLQKRNQILSDLSQGYYSCWAAGIIFGVCGSFIIGTLGFFGLAICTFISSLLILYAAVESRVVEHQKIFLTNMVACWVIWGLNSLYQGVVAGTMYALAALLISAVTFFGILYGLKLGYRFFTGTFRRTMLSCEVDSTKC